MDVWWFSWLPMSHESLESFKHLFQVVYFFRGPKRNTQSDGGARRHWNPENPDMNCRHKAVPSVEVVGGDIGYLRSTCLKVFGSSRFVHDHWRHEHWIVQCVISRRKSVVAPEHMHLFGCAQTSWIFWNSYKGGGRNMWLQGKHIPGM